MLWSIVNEKEQELIQGNGLARYRKFNVNGKTLITPALFASYWLGSHPAPWEIEELNTYLINAYDIYHNKKSCIKITSDGIHSFLAAQSTLFNPEKAIILMDSGGFSLLKTIEDRKLLERKLKEKLQKIRKKRTLFDRLYDTKHGINSSMEDENSIKKKLEKIEIELRNQGRRVQDFRENLYKIYVGSKPDLAVTLDYPFDPRRSDAYKRYKFSKENILRMVLWKIVVNGRRLAILPVIHPIAKELLLDIFKRLPFSQRPSALSFIDDEDIQRAIRDIPALGIGSLIPLLMHRAKGGREAVIKFLFDLRTKYYLDKFFHAFGIGGTTTMHLAFYLGCDSVDCAGWRRRAIYGIVQLPGTGDRYVTEKTKERLKWKGIPVLKGDELREFEDCKCPAHKKGYSTEDFDVHSRGSFELRAIHNLYVYVQEVKEAQKSIQNGEFESFVKERLSRSKIHRKLFESARKRVHDYWQDLKRSKVTQPLIR